MLANSGVNINDSVQVRNSLNSYYNRSYSYAAYGQVLSSCANNTLTYVLAQPGAEAEEYGYRFGFNGKEKDPEGMGGGGSKYDYGFRIYNAQIAKFLSVDPLTKEYPWYTPYQFAGNRPIIAIDLDGLEEWEVTDAFKLDKYIGKFWRIVESNAVLRSIWTSVTRKDLQPTAKVYYGILPRSEQDGFGGLGGYTVNLGDVAKFLDSYEHSSDKQFKKDNATTYQKYIDLFKANNLNRSQILKEAEKKTVMGVFLDPAEFDQEKSGERGTYTMFHEIAAHLKNAIRGINKTEKQEHKEFHNYDGNPELLKRYPILKDGNYSPPYEDIPENSPAGEIKREIQSEVSKQVQTQ